MLRDDQGWRGMAGDGGGWRGTAWVVFYDLNSYIIPKTDQAVDELTGQESRSLDLRMH